MERDVPVAEQAPPLGVVEAARLEAHARLARGVAHALNNALTAALGELGFLREDRKGDAAVVEACDVVAHEIERCARLVRALLARRHADREPERGGLDLVRATREAAGLARAALGRSASLEVRAPDDLVLIAADASSIELLVLLLVQEGAERIGGSGKLELAVDGTPTGARLALGASGAGAGHAAEDEDAARNRRCAVAELASRLGGRVLGWGAAPIAIELPRSSARPESSTNE